MLTLYDSWTNIKTLAQQNNLLIQYLEMSYLYKVYIAHEQNTYITELWKDTAKVSGIDVAQNDIDKQDFEDNYKDKSTKPVLHIKGSLVAIAPGSDESTTDITFTHATHIVGVTVVGNNSTKIEDYGEFSLVHPNPEIGELIKFGETVYLSNGPSKIDFVVPGKGTRAAANLIYRFYFKAIDTNGRKLAVLLHLKY